MAISKQEREDRRKKCEEYLRRAGSLPAAMALARRDGFSQNTSVWISALGKMLGRLNR
jgi:hypothetical protein